MIDQYLDILVEGLQKKIALLIKIEDLTRRQSEVLAVEPADFECFDKYVDEKDLLLDELLKLDEGFDLTYEQIREELPQNREKYSSYIVKLQELISEIMERSMSLQAKEARNKQTVEEAFRKERQSFKEGRLSSKAAMDYYRNANKTGVVPPQFLDKKK